MPVYQAPGVYVKEIPGSPPIAGVGTSTAAFIGEVDSAVTMPIKPGEDERSSTAKRYDVAPLWNTNDPNNPPTILVTNFEQFKNKFGDFQAGNKILAHAVLGFFENGGSRCWVIRIEKDKLSDANDIKGALEKLAKIDEIAIVAVPGALSQTVQEEVLKHCENLEDRFAILDGQRAIKSDGTPITIDFSSTKGTIRNSDYAAMYFPWIQVVDRSKPVDSADKPIPNPKALIPPSGHLAGIYARVDAERGVFKAPANEVVRGALALEYLVSKQEQEGLNPDGMNVIRSFDGNLKVWGARTLGGNQNEAAGKVKYINVRRLLNFLRESIDEGMQFAVFEPNNPALWQKITRALTGFLTNVWRDGALFGNTPEEAFYVKCDESTNPKDVRDLGQVVTEIGVAIVKPAEFVIFKISQEVNSSA